MRKSAVVIPFPAHRVRRTRSAAAVSIYAKLEEEESRKRLFGGWLVVSLVAVCGVAISAAYF